MRTITRAEYIKAKNTITKCTEIIFAYVQQTEARVSLNIIKAPEPDIGTDVKYSDPVHCYLSNRATNCLSSVGIITVGDLMAIDEDELFMTLIKIRNMGRVTRDEVEVLYHQILSKSRSVEKSEQ